MAAATSGLVWSVKNCHGVLAPHSSPMNSIGVHGEVSRIAAPAASRPGSTVAESRSPWARLPTWSCVWSEATKRDPGTVAGSTGRPCGRPRNVENVPSWKNGVRSTLASAWGSVKSA